jgi:hypothetical protein
MKIKAGATEKPGGLRANSERKKDIQSITRGSILRNSSNLI